VPEFRIQKPQIAYSLEQAADACGISLSLIKQFIRDGDLNPRYVNSKPIIPAPELAAWVDSLPYGPRAR
jgi:hypothetical protein